jgi:Fe-Mn family superoxide dismutase
MEHKNIMKKISLGIIALMILSESFSSSPENLKNAAMEKFDIHVFPALPYAYDALEPYIDARTMEIHYDKHHRAYFNNFVTAIKDTKYDSKTIYEIFEKVSEAGDAVRNNGGGFYNHVFFWNILSPKSGKPSAELMDALNKTFGSFDKFREAFSNSAKTRFGSGWAWLYVTSDKKLQWEALPIRTTL